MVPTTEQNHKRVAVMQPTYLPWLGYFNLMAEADIFILLDTADFSKNSFHNRNRVKLGDKAHYLTIPVVHKLGTRLCDQLIAENKSWARKHNETLKQAYSKAPFFNDYYPELSKLISGNTEHLCDITISIIKQISVWLDIKTKIMKSSELLTTNDQSGPVEKLVELLTIVESQDYLSPEGAFEYIEDSGLLQKNGVTVLYQHYKHPVYKQINNNFVDYLSAIDLLFNHGNSALAILKSGSHFEISPLNKQAII